MKEVKINEKSENMRQKEAEFIWSLLPKWVKDIPSEEHSYDPMYFGTLSREGDIKINKKVRKILFKE